MEQLRTLWDEQYARIAAIVPDAHCELVHRNAFELTIAVLLSAQCTDVMVNAVTPGLFAAYRTPQQFAEASVEDVAHAIRKIGLFRTKAKHIVQLCRKLIDAYGGEIPTTREELMTLPGIGRKSTNVILSTAFGVPAIAVDTHVERVSKRLGVVHARTSVAAVERELMVRLPEHEWTRAHHRLVLFGRYHCTAMRPQCAQCTLRTICPEGQRHHEGGWTR
jgi:endonuclease-3